MLPLSEFCEQYWLNFIKFLIFFGEVSNFILFHRGKYVEVGIEIFYEINNVLFR